MKPHGILLSAPLTLTLACAAAVLVGHNRQHPNSAYSVAAMRANLARHPTAWVGRPVLVRGYLDGCPQTVCPGHEPNAGQPLLVDLTQPANALLVAWADPDPLSAFLHRAPMLGTFAPAPQVPHWGAVATYRVTLGAVAGGACPTPPCYQALVLDAGGNMTPTTHWRG